MPIRNATYHDAPAIKLLLEALGYNARLSLLVNQLELMFNKDDHQVFVYDLRKEVIGFVSLHYLPQLAFEGGLMIITYFSVEEWLKNLSIAKELEQYVTNLARQRKCLQVEVHCMNWHTDAHQFYLQQGYVEYPKYFAKKID